MQQRNASAGTASRRSTRLIRWLAARPVVAGILALSLVAGPAGTAAALPKSRPSTPPAAGRPSHVVVIDIDNTHLTDMLAMPAVRAWFAGGTLMTNDHTDLISYTQPDYVNEVTGLYDSHTGILSNTQDDAGQSVSFPYWLDKLANGSPVHLSAPPWQWWNQHGYTVGAVGWADMELESDQEVPQYTTIASGFQAQNYLGFAVYPASGSPVLGLPNDPQVMNAPLLADPTQTVGVHQGSWDANFGPDRSLTEAATLLENNVPVVFDYIRSAHNDPTTGANMAPDTSAYQANLAHYNSSFAAFFANLKAHGLTPANTLVVMTSDEGDHFNPGGEITTSVPAWYSQLGLPTSQLTVTGTAANLVYWPTGTNVDLSELAGMPGWRYLVWGSALSAIHLETPVAADNPQLVQFADSAWYYGSSGSSTALTTDPTELWNHGNVDPGVNRLWVSFVGAGVPQGRTSREWVDSTGLLPTIEKLVTGQIETGLDGVVMPAAVSRLQPSEPADPTLGAPEGSLALLTQTYEDLNAPLGSFGRDAMDISTTAAIEPQQSGTLMGGLDQLVTQRDAVASNLHQAVIQADNGAPISPAQAGQLVAAAHRVLQAIHTLAEQAMVR